MTAARLFTLDDANRTLPYVRRVVTDLVRDYRDWQDTLAKYELASARRRAAEGNEAGGATVGVAAEAQRLEKRAALLATAIEAYLAEITAVGAEVKGFAEGLIDFPGELDGRSIRWCWMLGEAGVEHWHDTEAGFAGRQPVSTIEKLTETR
jgi:hypothetical protein